MNIPGNTFLPNWWSLAWSLAEIGWYSIIAPKGIVGPVNGWFSDSSFVGPVCQEVLDMSQITIAFHGISPPLAEVPSLILRTALSAVTICFGTVRR